MSSMDIMQKLLKEKADIQSKLKVSVFDGSIEVKTINPSGIIPIIELTVFVTV